MGLSPKEFSTIYGSQPGRNGAASTASNAGVSMELWGQHGAWKSVKSQPNYMKRDPEAIIFVSKDAMTPVPEANFGAPMPTVAVSPATIQSGVLPRASIQPPPTPGSPEKGPRFVEGVPLGSFAWQPSTEAHPLSPPRLFRRGSAIFLPLRGTCMPTLTYKSCGWNSKAWGPASE